MTIIITNTEAPWTFNDLGNIKMYLLSSFYILLFSKTFPHKWNYINFCEPELEIVIVMSKNKILILNLQSANQNNKVFQLSFIL